MLAKPMLCLLAALFIAIPSQAEEAEIDIDLLEFLADWESDDGEWMEPSAFENAESEGLESERMEGFRMKTTQEGHYEF
ncbi:MAG: hypothetical protein ACE5E3_01050 [Mariprofundus sp.]